MLTNRSIFIEQSEKTDFETAWINEDLTPSNSETNPLGLGFECEICKKFYKSKDSLRMHMNYRCNKKRNIFCVLCPFKTNLKQDLVRHIRAKHSENPNPYKCSQCNEIFNSRWKAVRHEEVCGMNLIFACDQCNHVSKSLNALQMHKYTEHRFTEEKICPKCGKTFKNVIELQNHMLTSQTCIETQT